MTKQKFHFGIIGCGAIAGVHAQAIAAMEDAHLESVCDSDPDRAKAFAQAQGWRGTWALDGGGALMNQGIHGIDLVQYIMGVAIILAAYDSNAPAKNSF